MRLPGQMSKPTNEPAGGHAPLTTLTEYERVGLEGSSVNLADGHAYHDLSSSQRRVIDRLPQIWTDAAERTQPAAERAYLDLFCDLARAEALRDHPH